METRGAATGGEVIWVDFEARVARREPPSEGRIDWLQLARSAEASALAARTDAERRGLIRCALEYRAKAGAVV